MAQKGQKIFSGSSIKMAQPGMYVDAGQSYGYQTISMGTASTKDCVQFWACENGHIVLDAYMPQSGAKCNVAKCGKTRYRYRTSVPMPVAKSVSDELKTVFDDDAALPYFANLEQAVIKSLNAAWDNGQCALIIDVKATAVPDQATNLYLSRVYRNKLKVLLQNVQEDPDLEAVRVEIVKELNDASK